MDKTTSTKLDARLRVLDMRTGMLAGECTLEYLEELREQLLDCIEPIEIEISVKYVQWYKENNKENN